MSQRTLLFFLPGFRLFFFARFFLGIGFFLSRRHQFFLPEVFFFNLTFDELSAQGGLRHIRLGIHNLGLIGSRPALIITAMDQRNN